MHHMHHDKTLFKEYHRLKYRLYVNGIQSGLTATGIGDVQIKDNSSNIHTREGILHVSELKNSLMSFN